MKIYYYILLIIASQLVLAKEDVVDSNLIMGRGKIYTFLTDRYQLTMEVCYDDGTDQIAMFSKENECWLYLNHNTTLNGFEFVLNGKKLQKNEFNINYKKIKFKDFNNKTEKPQSALLAGVMMIKDGDEVTLKMTTFLSGVLKEVILTREPFSFWKMKITSSKEKEGAVVKDE